jgi:uncharacterized protein YndB with AHSA1/START domain
MRDLVITREVDAPRALVWKAWSDPELFARWWGPKGFTSPGNRTDFRPGGDYLWVMRSPEGQDFYSTGVFREISPPERLVYTDSFADERGNVVSAAHYGMDPNFPLETVVTVTLDDLGSGRTRLTVVNSGMPVDENSELAGTGWNESLDKLEVFLQGQV